MLKCHDGYKPSHRIKATYLYQCYCGWQAREYHKFLVHYAGFLPCETRITKKIVPIDKRLVYVCSCGYKFDNYPMLQKHIKAYHNGQVENGTTIKFKTSRSETFFVAVVRLVKSYEDLWKHFKVTHKG